MEKNNVSNACKAMESLLVGGFPSGLISLLYGVASTGKTSLAMQCAVNRARAGEKVIFIDGDNAFSIKRLAQIAGDDIKYISDSIFLFTPSSFYEQSSLIENLDRYMSKPISLIIVDTITSLYRLELTSSQSAFMLNRELNRQLAYLASICKKNNVAIVVISGVHAILDETEKTAEVEPVAKRVLNFWSSITIKLERCPDSQFRKAIFEKHFEPQLKNSECLFRLTDNGLLTF